MRACFFRLLLLLFLTPFSLAPAVADTGGGSGVPVTPYMNDAKITVKQITCWKNVSRMLRVPADGIAGLFIYGNGLGLIYRNKHAKDQIVISEKVGVISAEIKIPDSLQKRLTIDEPTHEIILKGVMSLEERNRIINELWLQYDPSKYSRESFSQVEKALRQLYFKSHSGNDVFFEFRGTDESGHSISADFSVVKSFRIIRLEHQNQRALVEIEIFPDITPEKLLELKPSYTDLKAGYTRVIRMWVVLSDREKGDLYFADVRIKEAEKFSESPCYTDCGDFSEGDRSFFIESVKMFNKLEQNRAVVLEYNKNAVWWAVPSVIKDREYPFRQYFLLRGFLHEELLDKQGQICPMDS